jgi:hypothetical protein
MLDEIDTFKTMVNQYGLPIMAAGGMGYFIYFVWKFVTENINTELSNAKKTMVDLIDRIRMLDNDLIRLEQKINTAIEVNRADNPLKGNPTRPAATTSPFNPPTKHDETQQQQVVRPSDAANTSNNPSS